MTLEQSAPALMGPTFVPTPRAEHAARPMLPGTSGPRLILSVFPREQQLKLRHEGIKTYVMPAAEPGGYQTLMVHDTFSYNRNYHVEGFALFEAPVPAQVVAENLVQAWSTGLVGTKDGLGPGIMICAGLTPTPEEIAEVNKRQNAYFRSLIGEADALEGIHKAKDITDLHRLAAEWMGAKDRKWFRLISRVDSKSCPACAEEIRAEAKVCKHCNTNIAEFLAKEQRAAEAAARAAAKATPAELRA
jgi:hypothetical protein